MGTPLGPQGSPRRSFAAAAPLPIAFRSPSAPFVAPWAPMMHSRDAGWAQKSQGTPNHTFLPPNGSPSHHLGHGDQDSAQKFGPEIAVALLSPESQFLF